MTYNCGEFMDEIYIGSEFTTKVEKLMNKVSNYQRIFKNKMMEMDKLSR